MERKSFLQFFLGAGTLLASPAGGSVFSPGKCHIGINFIISSSNN